MFAVVMVAGLATASPSWGQSLASYSGTINLTPPFKGTFVVKVEIRMDDRPALQLTGTSRNDESDPDDNPDAGFTCHADFNFQLGTFKSQVEGHGTTSGSLGAMAVLVSPDNGVCSSTALPDTVKIPFVAHVQADDMKIPGATGRQDSELVLHLSVAKERDAIVGTVTTTRDASGSYRASSIIYETNQPSPESLQIDWVLYASTEEDPRVRSMSQGHVSLLRSGR